MKAVKIGVTGRYDINGRLRHCQTHCPDTLKCRLAVWGHQSEEAWLHRELSHLNIRGEWFVLTKELDEFMARANDDIVKRKGDRSPEWWKLLLSNIKKTHHPNWKPAAFRHDDAKATVIDRRLSKRQKELVDVIIKLTAKAGYPPTAKEMGAELNLSRERIRQHLNVLQRKKIITRSGGCTRSVVVCTKTE